MPRKTTWTDDDLRRAIADASSWRQVFELLQERTGAASFITARVRAAELQLDISALEVRRRTERAAQARARRGGEAGPGRRGRVAQRSWTDDDLRRAVEVSETMAAVHRELGITIGGSTYPMLKRRIAELGLDTSHFKGQGWSRGMEGRTSWPGRPLEEILVEDSTTAARTG